MIIRYMDVPRMYVDPPIVLEAFWKTTSESIGSYTWFRVLPEAVKSDNLSSRYGRAEWVGFIELIYKVSRGSLVLSCTM